VSYLNYRKFLGMKRSIIFCIYLALLGLAGIALLHYETAGYGPGVGTDGALQLSTADNLLRGRGFVDYAGSPFVRWPPLYPLALALLSWLSGMNTLEVGWVLNLMSYGGIIWLGGVLLYASFRDEPFWAYAGALVLATSVSLLSLSANIGTDPLFAVLVLAFLLVAARYQASGSKLVLSGMWLLACLASLERLPGITLIAVGGVQILFRKNSRSGTSEVSKTRIRTTQSDSSHIRGRLWSFLVASLFGLLAVAPLAAWLAYNQVMNKTLFGIPLFANTYPWMNFLDSLEKMWRWFLPARVTQLIPAVWLTAGVLLLFFLLVRGGGGQRLALRLWRAPIRVSLLFAAFYYLFLIFTVNSLDTSYPFYDRYYVIMLAPVLVLVIAALQELLVTRLPGRRLIKVLFLSGVLAAWLAYPLYNLNKDVAQARLEGVNGYNKYNTRALRQSKIVMVLRRVSQKDGRAIYSNYPAAVWFFTRQEALESPRGSINASFNLDDLLERFQGWPDGRPGYLVWFMPNEYDHVLSPAQLAQLADLKLIYHGKDGEVYRVSAEGK
jgi:hypothetical protein